jgi:hypothetical protein
MIGKVKNIFDSQLILANASKAVVCLRNILPVVYNIDEIIYPRPLQKRLLSQQSAVCPLPLSHFGLGNPMVYRYLPSYSSPVQAD